ncbi:probable WRKY transcription factor 26 [Dendrobium catenatum]|uniref:probable WRKY transcription factor 26 n=1 Tax=Dendrobium catenatum TaxID=906689 RepID=UPI0010A0121C|nr:probable WRKY transcription factor 26 [Dendrobium catenatum]
MASSTSTIIDQEEEAKEKNIAEERNNRTITIREDDYKWRKYGKKYIHKIKKYRSYFRCVNKTCKARKKLEWPPNEPNNIETTYEGDHNHRDRSENEEAGIAANQYDLATQMFGSART